MAEEPAKCHKSIRSDLIGPWKKPIGFEEPENIQGGGMMESILKGTARQ